MNTYQTKIYPNGKLDYRLIITHVPKYNLNDSLEYKKYASLIERISDESAQLFAHRSVELTYPPSDYFLDVPLSSKENDFFPSPGGMIQEETRSEIKLSQTPYIVHVGLYVGNCHYLTFKALLEEKVKEVHLPLDGIDYEEGKISKEILREGMDHDLLKWYKFDVIDKGYKVVIDGSEELNFEGANNNRLFMIHKTWNHFLHFLTRRRKQSHLLQHTDTHQG